MQSRQGSRAQHLYRLCSSLAAKAPSAPPTVRLVAGACHPVQVALAVRSCIGDELDAIPVLIIDVEKYSGWLSSIGDSAR
jgi:hypothetical protein